LSFPLGRNRALIRRSSKACVTGLSVHRVVDALRR
jgi:hypothetical protein